MVPIENKLMQLVSRLRCIVSLLNTLGIFVCKAQIDLHAQYRFSDGG